MAIGAASGSLVVSLALDAAAFVTGLNKSEYEAKRWAKNMEKVGREAGQLLSVGFAAGATALFFLTKNAIDSADALDKLSKKTGITVETLGGLGFAAKQSGSDLEGVANAFKKLNVNIAAGAAGKQDIADAFAAIGISAKDLKTLAPDQILAKIATAFAGYADGPEKAAIAQKLFGKAYQDIIPLLDQGGAKLQQSIDYYNKFGGVTTEVAQQASDFKDELAKLELLSGAFARTLAAELLPALQGLTAEFVAGKEKGNEFGSMAKDVAEFLKVIAEEAIYGGAAFVILGKGIGEVGALLAAAARGDWSGIKVIWEEADKEIDAVIARRDKLLAGLNNTKQGGGYNANLDTNPAIGRPRAPALRSADATDLAKKQFDAQIHDLETFIRQQKELEADQLHYLDANYQDRLISAEAFFGASAAIRDRTLQAELAGYDKEIALARQQVATAKPADKINAEQKLTDAIAKRQQAERQGAQARFDDDRKAIKAAQDYADSIAGISAQVLELTGHEVEAAAIRLSISQRDQREKNTVEGVSNAPLDFLKQQALAQTALNADAQKYAIIQGNLGVAQGRIALEQQTGAITELDAINKRSALAKEYVGLLQRQLAIDEQDALVLQGPARDAALLKIKQEKLAIDELSASADELQNKFRDIFEGEVANFITDVVTGTKSISAAFKDMEKNIVRSISNIASKNIAESLFGQGGAGSGIPSFFASLFGGGGAGSYFGAGAATLGGFADGGSPPLGRASLVGERGPELFVPQSHGTVIPNHMLGKLGRSNVVNINVNVPRTSSGASASQIAAATGNEVRRAMARNG